MKKKHSIESQKHLIFIVVGFAFLLRVWGTWYGLPDLYNSDEPFNVANALSYGAKKSMEPSYFVYPTLHSYLLFFVYGLYFIIGTGLGAFASSIDFAASYFLEPTGLFFLGRLLSAFMGTLTVWIVYKTGKENFSQSTGLVAATVLTLSYAHIDVSHWVLLEATVAAITALALLFIFRTSARFSNRNLVFASLFCGLAASTKYQAALVFLALLSTLFLQFRNDPLRLVRLTGLGLGVSILGFLIGSPYWLLSFSRFFETLQYTVSHVNAGMVGHVATVPVLWPFLDLLISDWTIGLLFIMGLIYGLFKRNRYQIHLIAFALSSLLIFGLWTRSGVHYLVPVFPALVLLAALFIEDVVSYVKDASLRRALVFAIVLPAIVKIGYQDIRLTQPDSRTLAKSWIERHLAPGSIIAYENYVYGPNLFDPRRFLENEQSAALPLELKERLLRERQRRMSYVLVNLRKDFKKRLNLSDEQPAQELDSYVQQLLDMRLPRLSSLRKGGIQFIVTSSDNYDRYFKATPPREGTPLWLAYQNGKHFYESVFQSPALELVREFKPGKWRLGPVVRVYRFRRDGLKTK